MHAIFARAKRNVRSRVPACTHIYIYIYMYVPVQHGTYVYTCNVYMRFGESADGTARLLG